MTDQPDPEHPVNAPDSSERTDVSTGKVLASLAVAAGGAVYGLWVKRSNDRFRAEQRSRGTSNETAQHAGEPQDTDFQRRYEAERDRIQQEAARRGIPEGDLAREMGQDRLRHDGSRSVPAPQAGIPAPLGVHTRGEYVHGRWTQVDEYD